MPVRLVITTHAKPGKGTELTQAMADRCRAVQQEPGCQRDQPVPQTPACRTSLCTPCSVGGVSLEGTHDTET